MNMYNDDSLVEKNFSIAIYNLDMSFSSTMPVICNYFYDVGIQHGPVVFGDTEIMSRDVVFVVTRFRIRIDKYPPLRTNVKVRSWISPIEHKHAVRNYMLIDESGDVCAKAICSIAAFNLKERAGVDISGHTAKARTLDLEPPFPHVFEKLPDVVSVDYENKRDVRYFDCDFYGHVTSIKYLNWCMETMPIEFLQKHRIYEVDVNFKRESSLGDKLIIKTSAASEENTFMHSIATEDGSKDIIRMKTIWR